MSSKSKHKNKQAQQRPTPAPDPWPNKIIIGFDGENTVQILATIPPTMNVLFVKSLLEALHKEMEKRIVDIASQIPAVLPQAVAKAEEPLELPKDPDEPETDKPEEEAPAATPPCDSQEGT